MERYFLLLLTPKSGTSYRSVNLLYLTKSNSFCSLHLDAARYEALYSFHLVPWPNQENRQTQRFIDGRHIILNHHFSIKDLRKVHPSRHRWRQYHQTQYQGQQRSYLLITAVRLSLDSSSITLFIRFKLTSKIRVLWLLIISLLSITRHSIAITVLRSSTSLGFATLSCSAMTAQSLKSLKIFGVLFYITLRQSDYILKYSFQYRELL